MTKLSRQALRTSHSSATHTLTAKKITQVLSDAESEAFPSSPPASQQERKKKCAWTNSQVLMLLREVCANPPMLMEHKHKMQGWKSIAESLCATGEFAQCNGVDGLGECKFPWDLPAAVTMGDVNHRCTPACRAKLQAVLQKHKRDDKAAPFRSGSDEEVTEATTLLDNLAEIERSAVALRQEGQQQKAERKEKQQVAETIMAEAAMQAALPADKRATKRKGKRSSLVHQNGCTRLTVGCPTNSSTTIAPRVGLRSFSHRVSEPQSESGTGKCPQVCSRVRAQRQG